MRRLAVITVVWVGLLMGLRATLGQRQDVRNYEYAPDMVRTFAYPSQTANEFLPYGQTQQPPPEGTIPLDREPLHFGLGEEEGRRAGELLVSPFSGEKKPDLARGRELYDIWCMVCHGVGGKGDGPVVRRGYPAPPSLLLERARTMKDGQIFHIITYGFNNMPAYCSQIPRDDRWQIVAYVRTLQESEP